jgi:hypothetical protein
MRALAGDGFGGIAGARARARATREDPVDRLVARLGSGGFEPVPRGSDA